MEDTAPLRNELRIGNLVHPFPDGNAMVAKVASLPNYGVHALSWPANTSSFSGPPEGFRGIPITEDWLKRMGWKYLIGLTGGDLTKDAWEARLDLDWIDGCIQIKSRYLDLNHYQKLKHILYVHQLQNLYYFLTGKELEVGHEL